MCLALHVDCEKNLNGDGDVHEVGSKQTSGCYVPTRKKLELEPLFPHNMLVCAWPEEHIIGWTGIFRGMLFRAIIEEEQNCSFNVQTY